MKASHLSLSRFVIVLPAIVAAIFLSGCESLFLDGGDDDIRLEPALQAKAIAILSQGLHAEGEDNFWVSIHAAEGLTLAGYGEQVRAFLEPKLATDHDAQHRCGIARELFRAGDTAKLSVLTEVLTSDDPYGHVHAAESLYKIYEVGDAETMRRNFLEAENIRLRLMAAAALARQGDLDAVAFIRESLQSTDPEALRISAWILGRIGGEQDIEPLRARLEDAPDAVIRAYVEHSLATLGDSAGRKALKRNLESDDPAIRTYAATFAGDARLLSLRSQLEEMLNDPHIDARVRAAQTLLQFAE